MASPRVMYKLLVETQIVNENQKSSHTDCYLQIQLIHPVCFMTSNHFLKLSRTAGFFANHVSSSSITPQNQNIICHVKSSCMLAASNLTICQILGDQPRWGGSAKLDSLQCFQPSTRSALSILSSAGIPVDHMGLDRVWYNYQADRECPLQRDGQCTQDFEPRHEWRPRPNYGCGVVSGRRCTSQGLSTVSENQGP